MDRYHAEVQATKERNDPERRIREIMLRDVQMWAEPDQTLISEEENWSILHSRPKVQ